MVDSSAIKIKNWENPKPIVTPMNGYLTTPSYTSVHKYPTPTPESSKALIDRTDNPTSIDWAVQPVTLREGGNEKTPTFVF